MTDRLKAPSLPEAPFALKRSVKDAKARTLSRRHGPVIGLIQRDDGTLDWDWPFKENEDGDWTWLVLNTFGTRYANVAACFINHLIELCGQQFDQERSVWVPEAAELTMMLHIVSAHRPKDEAQAALAAQIAATHLLTMKVAKRVADYTYDTRMIGAFAKLVRASAAQIETMGAMKGKRRTVRQKISVSHEKHVHQHQHVHLDRGTAHKERQPHETEEVVDAPLGLRAGLADGGPSMPSPAEARSRAMQR